MKEKIIIITGNVSLFAGLLVGLILKNQIVAYVFAALLVGGNIGAFIYTWKQLAKAKKNENFAVTANDGKSEYLTALSHGIRTPMQAVLGMTNIAQKNLDNPKVVADCLEKIDFSGKHLLALVNDIVDYSKIEKGKMVTTSNVFSLKKQASFLQAMFEQDLKNKKLAFSVQFDTKYEYVFADELRLNQILVNLISNAIKYTNEGGTVTLKIIEKGISFSNDKVQLNYKVCDTGIGMNIDTCNRVFNAYERGIDSRVNAISGSGLGLTITKRLVDLIGGVIFVDSVVGQGSEFTVSLDAMIAPNQKDVSTVEIKDKIDANILVVEDNDLNYEIISSTLEPYGIKTTHAENGQKAFELMKLAGPNEYDLILMDIEMPNMNGYEATKAIRQIKNIKLANIPIYAITADAFSTDIAKCKEAGMNGHISKPIDFTKILNIIQKNTD